MTFMEITNATHEKAQKYLQVTSSLEQAISLFMESGGADLQPAVSEPPKSFLNEPEITREPIAPRTETLLDDFSIHGHSHPIHSRSIEIQSKMSMDPSQKYRKWILIDAAFFTESKNVKIFLYEGQKITPVF